MRVDSFVYSGYTVQPHYDSLIAKLTVWGENRATAIVRMKRSLDELVIEGIKTTIDFHKKLLETSAFIEGQVHTNENVPGTVQGVSGADSPGCCRGIGCRG